MNKIKLACLLLSLSFFSAQADVPELSTTASPNFSGQVHIPQVSEETCTIWARQFTQTPADMCHANEQLCHAENIDLCPLLTSRYSGECVPFEEHYYLFDKSSRAPVAINPNKFSFLIGGGMPSSLYYSGPFLIAAASYIVLKSTALGMWNAMKNYCVGSDKAALTISNNTPELRIITLKDCIGIPLFAATTIRLMHPENMGMQAILGLLPDSIAAFIGKQLIGANLIISMNNGVLWFTANSFGTIAIAPIIATCVVISAIITIALLKSNYNTITTELFSTAQNKKSEIALENSKLVHQALDDSKSLQQYLNNYLILPENKQLMDEPRKQDINQSEQLSPEICINK